MDTTGHCSLKTTFQKMTWLRFSMVTTCVLWILGGDILLCTAGSLRNTIILANQSGQNAVVRVVGSTRVTVRIAKQQKKTVRVAEGEYYLLARYGDSDKEYTYTKSNPFLVTESDTQFSIVTFTLHRRAEGDFHTIAIPEEEFENPVASKETLQVQ